VKPGKKEERQQQHQDALSLRTPASATRAKDNVLLPSAGKDGELIRK